MLSAIEVAVQNGELDRAHDLFERLIAGSSPQQKTEHQFGFAYLLWQSYEIEKADRLFQQIILDSDLPLATFQTIAKCYFQIGRFGSAAEVMRAAVKIYPRTADAFAQLSSCLERSNQLSHAMEAVQQSLRLESDHGMAVRQMARIKRREGDLDNAISVLRIHLQRHPAAPSWLVRQELAACLDRSGDYNDAWHELLLAKTELRPQSLTDLKTSYSIRKRQGELVQSITKVDWDRWHHGGLPSRYSLVFLAGFPRSGTTLLETVLTQHGSVIGTDESGVMTSQFIRPMIWEAPSTLDALIELRGLDEEQIEIGRTTYLKCTAAVLGQPIGERLLVEKDPLLTCDLALPLRLFPEAKLIMPLRDPRDVALSYFFTILPTGWNGAPSIDIGESARFYHDVMRHWLLLRDRLPWPSLATKYEDFVQNPEHETQRLFQFLKLDSDGSRTSTNQRTTQKWITTPTYEDVSRPVYSSSISRWKNYRDKLAPAMAILEPWAKELGYE